jgi:hypothetical protein
MITVLTFLSIRVIYIAVFQQEPYYYKMSKILRAFLLRQICWQQIRFANVRLATQA